MNFTRQYSKELSRDYLDICFFSSYLILGDYIFKGISKAGHFQKINPGGSQSVRHSKVCQYKYRQIIDDPSPRYSKLFVCKGHVNIPASIANYEFSFEKRKYDQSHMEGFL